jgi:ubiquinone/menaquinone biosynthesis C-methylase UbiE
MRDSILERQRVEERYHDEKTTKSASCYRGDQNGADNRFFSSLIGDVAGLNVLDFGCGDGWYSIKLGMSRANVWGIDISGELISRATRLAVNKGLSQNVCFKKMAGENLTFPDNFFDLVTGSAILHHTDIKKAVENIFRVLKPGGRAIFIEPLNVNIFLKIWRKLTPWRRTPTEKAFLNSDLEFIQKIFPLANYNYFYFISIFTQGLLYLFRKNKFLLFINGLIEMVDSWLIKELPFLGKYCAVVVLELKKGNN